MNTWSREHIHGDGLTASCVPQTPSNPIFCRKLSARVIPTSAFREVSAILADNFRGFASGCQADYEKGL